jgi:hypothetical protein
MRASVSTEGHIYHRTMTLSTALFPSLLGDRWHQLPSSVQRMHGDAALVSAHGAADVDGATNLLARCCRHVVRLPEPGPAQSLQLTIERHGTQEIWTRRFARGHMRSVLDRVDGRPMLSERLGPVVLRFDLRYDDGAIDWRLESVRVMGVPLPRRWFGHVLSRSAESGGRYMFLVDVQLPWVGRLVAYRGWLEIMQHD